MLRGASATGLPLSVTTVTATGLVDLSASGAGQVKFPATQNASSNANTLDDYEEGTWTPSFTFATPGDLSVTYSTRIGTYVKKGQEVTVECTLATSAFTHSTASGNFRISGFPFSMVAVTGIETIGACAIDGIAVAGYTQFCPVYNSNSNCNVQASGTGVARTTLTIANVASGGTPSIASLGASILSS